MKTYFSDLIPKIQRFSEKLDDLTHLKNHHWVLVNEILNSKTVYIFRDNDLLLISENGAVKKAKWEYLNHTSILIETEELTTLVNQSFVNEDTLVLNIDGSDNYAFFINETKYGSKVNSFSDIIEYLENKYLKGIYLHQNKEYYYIQYYKEHGPYTIEQIIRQVREGEVNKMAFIRNHSDKDYGKKVRIIDIIEVN